MSRRISAAASEAHGTGLSKPPSPARGPPPRRAASQQQAMPEVSGSEATQARQGKQA